MGLASYMLANIKVVGPKDPAFYGLHSQFMTKVELAQVFSCWSNVGRLRFDQHVTQLTNFGQ